MLCAPVTENFFEIYEQIKPFLGALVYKNCNNEFHVKDELEVLFESAYGLVADIWVDEIKNENLFEFLSKYDAVSYACDLGPACRKYKNDLSYSIFPRSYPITKILAQNEILDLAKERIQWVRGNYLGVIKFELLNYYPTGAYEHVCEPSFIRRFLEEINGELILDVGHARISAENLGIPFDKYLGMLPIKRITEVHFSKPSRINGILEDTHEEPDDEDYLILEEIMNKYDIKYVVVEYYKDKSKLKNIYTKLFAMLQGF